MAKDITVGSEFDLSKLSETPKTLQTFHRVKEISLPSHQSTGMICEFRQNSDTPERPLVVFSQLGTVYHYFRGYPTYDNFEVMDNPQTACLQFEMKVGTH